LWDLQPEIAAIGRDTLAHLNSSKLPHLETDRRQKVSKNYRPQTGVGTDGDLRGVCDDARESRYACWVFVKLFVELSSCLRKD